ncbi:MULTISPECIES: hypothetical protein [Falsihalocynthiibacter]|uniref:Ferrochelatase n=1 Tax=Falsihalocynthiibacter arcticus TaxID=1579316 RepID=A0A126UZ08_9RHOB|nr:hypothetical protein [Falsihalocynthiibacter arcticus]AML50679.1 hypothetical protein RC74_04740 [Falsihalocynthiibacter arcticus]
MKKITALTAVLALSATTAFAGSPEVVVSEPMPDVFIAEEEGNNWLPLALLGLVAVAAVVASNNDDT